MPHTHSFSVPRPLGKQANESAHLALTPTKNVALCSHCKCMERATTHHGHIVNILRCTLVASGGWCSRRLLVLGGVLERWQQLAVDSR